MSCARTLLALNLMTLTALAAEPRLNQIQVIGTHNSYHIAPHADLMGLLSATSKTLGQGLDYTHKPLAEQFSELGIRQIELDIFADPQGGLYAEPSSRKTLKALGRDPGPDPDVDGVLRKPGLKVLHVPDIDYQTTASTFTIALRQIRTWSQAHPHHVPIMVLVEVKDSEVAALPTKPLPFDKAALDSIDAEIDAVFGRSEIFTPDDLRGEFTTLPQAISQRGWPALNTVRGKVIFGLDNEDTIRDRYLEGHEALAGRRMFTTVPSENHPAAAWFKINDPIKDFDRIQNAVAKGFLVRTRADADTRQARANDPTQRDKALASGAQFVSTDYPEARPEFSTYSVKFEAGTVARANPVSAKGLNVAGDLEARTVAGPESLK